MDLPETLAFNQPGFIAFYRFELLTEAEMDTIEAAPNPPGLADVDPREVRIYSVDDSLVALVPGYQPDDSVCIRWNRPGAGRSSLRYASATGLAEPCQNPNAPPFRASEIASAMTTGQAALCADSTVVELGYPLAEVDANIEPDGLWIVVSLFQHKPVDGHPEGTADFVWTPAVFGRDIEGIEEVSWSDLGCDSPQPFAADASTTVQGDEGSEQGRDDTVFAGDSGAVFTDAVEVMPDDPAFWSEFGVEILVLDTAVLDGGSDTSTLNLEGCGFDVEANSYASVFASADPAVVIAYSGLFDDSAAALDVLRQVLAIEPGCVYDVASSTSVDLGGGTVYESVEALDIGDGAVYVETRSTALGAPGSIGVVAVGNLVYSISTLGGYDRANMEALLAALANYATDS
ncbi:MAG: hypothetical protein ACE367_18420 [Acidimicrobiales bacterium]